MNLLVQKDLVRIGITWLPLVDVFSNREIEFGFTLQNIKTLADAFQFVG